MVKVRKAIASVLVGALLFPVISLAQPQSSYDTSSSSSTTVTSSRQKTTRATGLQRSRTVRRASYQEGSTHRRRHVSKAEIAMMAAVAGTSMSIGAIAGGGTGLAIGALVGGWGAYAVHRLWRHIH